MADDADYGRALAYFTDAPHEASYEVLKGRGRVVLSAPHAVTQWRDGRVKDAERYTGVLLRLLHARLGAPCIYKTRNMRDDANHDAQSPYRDALCTLMRKTGARYLLDLHQLSPKRGAMLCIGTGRGRNLCGDPNIAGIVRDAFEARDIGPVMLDEPFAAMGRHTVCGDLSGRLGVPAIQLEISTCFLQEDCPERNFDGVLDALCHIVTTLNEW